MSEKRIGRPPKYTDPAEMAQAIEDYFKECEKGRTVTLIRKGQPVEVTKKLPPSMAGLALTLGFSSRQTLLNYSGKPDFMDIIARARLRIEEDLVIGGILGDYEPKLTALNLASNFGYTTRTEVKGDIKSHSDILVVMENKCIILICRQLFVLNLN